MSRCDVKIKFKRLRDSAVLPTKSHTGDLGFDLYVVTDSHFTHDVKEKKWYYDLLPLKPRLFDVGFSTEIPSTHGILLQDRSGLASKGISVLGGVIDSGYRGVWAVCLINLSKSTYRIYEKDKICQAIIVPNVQARWESVEKLSNTDREAKGFGSSGR